MRSPLLRHRFERIGLAIGIALTILIVIAVINRVLQSDQGPLEPTPDPTTQPTVGPTQLATPATPGITFDPEPAPEIGSLQHMLGYAPDRLQDDSLPLSDIAQYANIDLWMQTQGVPVPTGPNDPGWDAWHDQLSALAIPEVLATRGTDGVWMQTYGFGLHEVDQVLAVGSAPDYVMVMRGDFDEATLHAAWADSGYQAVRVEGVTYWSLYPGGSVDLSAPASRPALGNMNNLVLLEDGTLIATARSDRMEQTIRTVQGMEPTLADNAEIQTLLTPGTEPELLVTGILLKGSVLEELTVQPAVVVATTPQPNLPQASMLLAGLQVRPDTEHPTTMVIMAVYESAPEATQAHMRAEDELANDISHVTNDPYSARVNPLSMRVIASGQNEPLLLMQLTLANGSNDWLEIVEERDLGYLMWPRVP